MKTPIEPIATTQLRFTSLVAIAAIGLCATASAVDRTYQYFRYTATQLRNNATANSIQLSEFQFIDNGTPLDLSGVTVTNPGGNNPGGEQPLNIIDGDTGSKWLDFTKFRPLVFQFPAAVTIDTYNFATAGDADERDPVSWRFEGSDDGVTWEPLDNITNYPTTTERVTYQTPGFSLPAAPAVGIASFTTNRTTVINGSPVTLDWSTFEANLGVSIAPAPGAVAASGTASVTPPSNGDTFYTLTATSTDGSAAASVVTRAVAGGISTFQFVRFTPVELRDTGNAAGIQLSEFTLLNGITPLVPVAATNPGGTNPPEADEGALKAIDGDITTKYFDGNIQPLILDLGASVPFDGYRFGSGNDAPERDPVRWIIEGSNDGVAYTLIESVMSFDYPFPLERLALSHDIPLPGTSLVPPITLFVTNSPKLLTGESATLTYNTIGATSVTISGVGAVATSGSVSVSPASTTTYILTATGTGSPATATVTVEVINPPITTINYQNFDLAGEELALLGDAAIVNDFANIPLPGDVKRLRVTPDAGSSNGTVWFRKRVNIGLGFETFFDLQFNTQGDTEGADGMAFIIQNSPIGSAATLTQNAEDGLTSNALNIKFDSFDNGDDDPSSAFVQVRDGTTILATVNLADFPGLVTNNDLSTQGGTAAPYTVRVNYLPGDLDVFFNNTLVVDSLDVDLGAIGAVDGSGKAFVGFAARTGGFFEAHDVTRWILREGSPTLPLVLKSHVFNFATDQLTLTWESSVGKTYRITRSPELMTWEPVLTGIPGAAGETTRTISFVQGTKEFFRVEQE